MEGRWECIMLCNCSITKIELCSQGERSPQGIPRGASTLIQYANRRLHDPRQLHALV